VVHNVSARRTARDSSLRQPPFRMTTRSAVRASPLRLTSTLMPGAVVAASSGRVPLPEFFLPERRRGAELIQRSSGGPLQLSLGYEKAPAGSDMRRDTDSKRTRRTQGVAPQEESTRRPPPAFFQDHTFLVSDFICPGFVIPTEVEGFRAARRDLSFFSTLRSSHLGFRLSTRAIFFCLDHRLSCFSRSIAAPRRRCARSRPAARRDT
jgi:hypothetical protein